jgi:hypothetical protein
VTRAQEGYAALAALLVAAVVLLAVELANGALDYGESTVADPCQPREPYPGDGFDATLQRIALDGLDGAACELETSREELVLSFDPLPGQELEWDRETIERAVRSGLLEAVDDAEERGGIGSFEATILSQIVERAPIDWLLEGGEFLGGLFDDLREP